MKARRDISWADGSWAVWLLPGPLTGFFAAVMVGAILSSFNSALNASATLFSLGVYKNIVNKDASEEQVVKSGKIFGWIFAIVAMTIAPLLANVPSILQRKYRNTMLLAQHRMNYFQFLSDPTSRWEIAMRLFIRFNPRDVAE